MNAVKNDMIKGLSNITDLDKDYQKILGNLYYTHFWLANKYKDIFSKYDITPQQSNILGTIFHFHPKPLTLNELKELLLETNADVSRVVSRLVDKKLLKRKINEENRRKVEITATEKGLKLIRQVNREELFKRFTAGFTLEEARIFSTLLAKLRVDE